MKIYNRVVISMRTLQVVEADSIEYSGPVAQCKGGSSTTNTVDYAYNARMATIAEAQQGMAEQYFNFWQSTYKPMEAAQVAANMSLIPWQAATERERLLTERQQMAAVRGLIPQEASTQSARLNTEQAQLAAERRLIPAGTDLSLAQMDLQRAQISGARGLVPLTTEVQRAGLEASRGLIPKRAALESEQIGAQRELLPQMTETAHGVLANQINENAAAAPVMEQYYKQALKGVDINRRVNEARSNVAQGFAESSDINRREAGRLGIMPGSGRYARMVGSTGLNRAKATAGAMSGARNQAEAENFQRLQGATSSYKAGLPNF